MKKLIFLLWVLPIFVYSQKNETFSFGILSSNKFNDIGFYSKKIFNDKIFKINISYVYDENYGKNIGFNSNGFSLGFEFNKPLNEKKNHFYLGIGLLYRNIFTDSVVIFTQQIDYSQTEYSKYYILQLGIGKNWTFGEHLEFEMFCGINPMRLDTKLSNFHTISLNSIYAVPKENKIIYSNSIGFYPSLNFSLGFKI